MEELEPVRFVTLPLKFYGRSARNAQVPLDSRRPDWLRVRLPGGPKYGELPTVLDLGEPVRVAEAVERMGLKHAVITSVNRDELEDGGAGILAGTIRQIRKRLPHCGIEVLIPDFEGNAEALATVMRARPDILKPQRGDRAPALPAGPPQGALPALARRGRPSGSTPEIGLGVEAGADQIAPRLVLLAWGPRRGSGRPSATGGPG